MRVIRPRGGHRVQVIDAQPPFLVRTCPLPDIDKPSGPSITRSTTPTAAMLLQANPSRLDENNEEGGNSPVVFLRHPHHPAKILRSLARLEGLAATGSCQYEVFVGEL